MIVEEPMTLQARAAPMITHAPITATLQVHLLGGFWVQLGATPILPNAWQRRKAQALVKLLALAPGHRLHREQVLDLLWPDLDVPAAANNLHVVLHAARRALTHDGVPSPYLCLEHDQVLLAPHGAVWVDVEAFTAAAAAARHTRDYGTYETALALYSGDLLPEDRYVDWVVAHSEFLRSVYLDLLEEQAQLAAASGDGAAAIATLTRLLAHEPTHEAAHLMLMRLYAVSGQRHHALRQYASLRDTLQRELDAEPDEAAKEVYQALVTGRFPASFPAVLHEAAPGHLGTPLHNLPAALTSFIGRERELDHLCHALPPARLLTLTGPGGVGKTRIAQQVARSVADQYGDGVWLVELASLTDGALVAETIAAALDLGQERERPMIASLIAALKGKHMLLLLDNCEHVLDACAAIVAALLRACPHLHVLATSRESLHVPGEVCWLVPPLRLPDVHQLPPVDSCAANESVRFFMARAQEHQPSFVLTAHNAAHVVAICRRLDGLPLALELAAARVPALGIERLAARLDHALHMLTNGDHTGAERQHTLRATLEWDYALLNPVEQTVLDRLAIFVGGWTLAAAEAVVAGGVVPTEDVLDVLARLVDKSLIMVDTDHADTVRYRLLEATRLYARERLHEKGETGTLALAHARFFLALTQHIDQGLRGAAHRQWVRWLETEHRNVHAALHCARVAPLGRTAPRAPVPRAATLVRLKHRQCRS